MRQGLLEKHKDYVLRARDYHRKQDRLTKLKRKAAFRNPDEFYFAMHSSKTKAGVHEVRGTSDLCLHSIHHHILHHHDPVHKSSRHARKFVKPPSIRLGC
jgi:hypothetical protein